MKNKCKNCGCFIGENKHSCTDIRTKQSKSHKEKKHTEETKLKMKKPHKYKLEENKRIGIINLKKYYNDGGKQIMKGDTHWNWKGGVSPINRKLRTHSKWKIWRELVFLRDNFTCQNPNCEFCNNKIGIMLHPHHIKPLSLYQKLAFNINNGITYCAEYHLKSKELHKGIVHKLKCEKQEKNKCIKKSIQDSGNIKKMEILLKVF